MPIYIDNCHIENCDTAIQTDGYATINIRGTQIVNCVRGIVVTDKNLLEDKTRKLITEIEKRIDRVSAESISLINEKIEDMKAQQDKRSFLAYLDTVEKVFSASASIIAITEFIRGRM